MTMTQGAIEYSRKQRRIIEDLKACRELAREVFGEAISVEDVLTLGDVLDDREATEDVRASLGRCRDTSRKIFGEGASVRSALLLSEILGFGDLSADDEREIGEMFARAGAASADIFGSVTEESFFLLLRDLHPELFPEEAAEQEAEPEPPRRGGR